MLYCVSEISLRYTRRFLDARAVTMIFKFSISSRHSSFITTYAPFFPVGICQEWTIKYWMLSNRRNRLFFSPGIDGSLGRMTKHSGTSAAIVVLNRLYSISKSQCTNIQQLRVDISGQILGLDTRRSQYWSLPTIRRLLLQPIRQRLTNPRPSQPHRTNHQPSFATSFPRHSTYRYRRRMRHYRTFCQYYRPFWPCRQK